MNGVAMMRTAGPKGGVIVIEPSPLGGGWLILTQQVGGQSYHVGVCSSWGAAYFAGPRLASRFGATFCPIGREMGGAA